MEYGIPGAFPQQLAPVEMAFRYRKASLRHFHIKLYHRWNL
jgi:hypothetical protein